MAKAKKINPAFPQNFRRTMGRLYARAHKCDSHHEASKLVRAAYRAQDRARAEADRSLWNPMIDEVEALHREAQASVEATEKKTAQKRAEEIAKLRRDALERARRDPRNM